ncbi:tetratricopeptide repeat protein [Marinibaculum pumilum]|uniref:protein O-GlcNAc transferase n=2 Tax=Marinibaculum pumilum TaxID=1766165 RepID=A0ABV7KXX7_9PROT
MADPVAAAAPRQALDAASAALSRGDRDAAEAAYRAGLAVAPDSRPLLTGLADLLRDALLTRGVAAMREAVELYRRALQAAPKDISILNSLGLALRELGELDPAIEIFEAARQIQPQQPVILCNLGSALMGAGRPADAQPLLAEAARLAPQDRRINSVHLFSLCQLSGARAEAVVAAHCDWGRRAAAAAAPRRRMPLNDRDPDRRLRVGYVSPDFRRHSVSSFMEGVIGAHDRRAVEVVCYAEVAVPDEATARWQKLADRFLFVCSLDDTALAERVRQDGIDILVDLAGHTANTRLGAFAEHPAPIQVEHPIGYAHTTGLPAMDYMLTNAWLSPPGTEAMYAEHLFHLDGPIASFTPAAYMPEVQPSPHLRNGHIRFGCLSRAVKITDATLEAWGRILRALPGSVLALNYRDFAADGSARRRILAALERFHVAPERVDFTYTLQHPHTLAYYHSLDVYLDTFPNVGGTTTCEALCMGVPVVMLAGETPIRRVGAAWLGPAGLQELITETMDDYVQTAVALALDSDRLRQLRGELRRRFLDAVGDHRRIAADYEQAYRRMWQAWVRGMAAAGL